MLRTAGAPVGCRHIQVLAQVFHFGAGTGVGVSVNGGNWTACFVYAKKSAGQGIYPYRFDFPGQGSGSPEGLVNDLTYLLQEMLGAIFRRAVRCCVQDMDCSGVSAFNRLRPGIEKRSPHRGTANVNG
jgi:hypothetical protein